MPLGFTIAPQTALFDEPIHVRLSGLTPGQTVTIQAQRGEWTSQAVYAADAEGNVDLAQQAPLSGSYDGIDPMGLFWSMEYAHPESVKLSLLWGDSLDPAPTHFRAQIGGETIAEGEVIRSFIVPGVRRVVLHEDGLRGVLFEPTDPVPHPGIIIVSGSGGGLSDHRAALYAAHGYAALSLAYFNYDDLPDGLVEIPLEYFQSALRWLQVRPGVDPDRVAYSGGSRGGELSLLLGATFPEIKAVVAYVPSGYIWGGIDRDDNTRKAAWTYQGKPLPFIPPADDPEVIAQSEALAQAGEPIPLTPGFRASVKATSDLSGTTIPVEKINGAILLISGEDDQMWPSATFGEQIMERLDQYHFPHAHEHLHYPNAGHLILAPYMPTTVKASGHPLARSYFAYGGTPKGGAFANADSWPKVIRFLDQHLKA